MLKNQTKQITLKGSSVVTVTDEETTRDVVIKNFTATIDSSNPGNMTISEYFNGNEGKELYKDHRTECRADEAEFEDMAYAFQDEMIAAVEAETETE